MKRFLKLDNILSMILSIYLTLVITYVTGSDLSFLFLGPVLIFALFLIIRKVLKILDNINLFSNTKINIKEVLVYTILIIIVMTICYVVNIPTIYNVSSDVINQYNEAITNTYSDWHPLFHTLLFFKLPTIINNSLSTCAVFQLMFVGLITLYFAYFCRKYFLNHKWTLFILILFLANPIIMKMSTTLWKDIPFSFSMMLLTMNLIEIFIDKNWLNSNKNKLLFIIGSFGIIFFRHNGILSFLIMMCLLIIFNNKKKFLIILLIIMMSLKFVSTPIYKSLNIGPNGGIAECLGVPLNQMSYIFNMQGKVTDDELNLMNNIESLQYWEKYFDKKSFNIIKWNGNYDFDYVKSNYKKILSTWLNMIKDNPKLAIDSYINVTSPIWELTIPLSFNSANITDGSFANYIFNDYYNILENSILRIFVIDIGDGLFLTLLAFALIVKKYKFNIKSLIPFSLTISNTLIIMLLITGEEIRFVYAQILCAYPLILYSLKKHEERKDILGSTILQFIKYFFVGLIAAIVNIAMLYIFTDLIKINYIISNIISFTLGLIVNYILSKKYVFVNEKIDNKNFEFVVYGLIGITGLLIDTLLLFILVDKFSIYYLIGKIISTLIVFIWNFVVRKIFYKVVGGKI